MGTTGRADHRLAYDIEILTPLFGGGVEPNANDPVTLVRGTSIRGQLRFWWRATRGARFQDAVQLRLYEDAIWGSADSPSPIWVRVSGVRPGRCAPWAHYETRPDGRLKSIPAPEDRDFPMYALFPFAKDREDQPKPAVATWTASFRLELGWTACEVQVEGEAQPVELRPEVEAAVWAWVNFGGLGARTRRGCGSLYCPRLSPTRNDVGKLHGWYDQCLQRYGVVLADDPRDWPTLPAAADLLTLTHGDGRRNDNGRSSGNRQATGIQAFNPVEAWRQAIELLQEFRQGTGIGRNPGGSSRPGRSRWPEADSVRRITHQSCPTHRQPITTNANAFPRAEFGMPIIFHFKDDRQGDPSDHQLKPVGKLDRMASPLILKALCVASGPDDQHPQAVPLILHLRTRPVDEAELAQSQNRVHSVGTSEIRRRDLATYCNSPMAGRTRTGSALEAFMSFARERGFH